MPKYVIQASVGGSAFDRERRRAWRLVEDVRVRSFSKGTGGGARGYIHIVPSLRVILSLGC